MAPRQTGRTGRTGRSRRPKHAAKVERAGDLATRAIASIVPERQIRLARIQIAWAASVPVAVRRVASPAAVQGDTVVIHVVDNQWLHELTYMRADLVDQLHGAGVPGICDVRLRVGPVEVIEPPPPPPPLPPPPLPAEPERATIDAMASVDDGQLRQAIANARLALGRY
jgi:hypothetical protein